MEYIVVIREGINRQTTGGEFFVGKYIEGPLTPGQVATLGYGFTSDPAKAWPFPSIAQACNKARIVSTHMGWGAPRFMDVEEVAA